MEKEALKDLYYQTGKNGNKLSYASSSRIQKWKPIPIIPAFLMGKWEGQEFEVRAGLCRKTLSLLPTKQKNLRSRTI
jgi:hypothetical protein